MHLIGFDPHVSGLKGGPLLGLATTNESLDLSDRFSEDPAAGKVLERSVAGDAALWIDLWWMCSWTNEPPSKAGQMIWVGTIPLP